MSRSDSALFLRQNGGKIPKFVHFDGSCGEKNTIFLANMEFCVIIKYKRMFIKL